MDSVKQARKYEETFYIILHNNNTNPAQDTQITGKLTR